MKENLVKLQNWGCDVEGALPRLINDEDFLLECIEQVSGDPAFEALGECLEKKDAEGAFEAAHSLKGIIANTGITPLLDIIVKIVEPLRLGEAEGLEPYYKELIEKRSELLKVLGE